MKCAAAAAAAAIEIMQEQHDDNKTEKRNKEHALAQPNERQTRAYAHISHAEWKKRKAQNGARKSENQTVQYYAALIIGVVQFFIMPIMNGEKQSVAHTHTHTTRAHRAQRKFSSLLIAGTYLLKMMMIGTYETHSQNGMNERGERER